MSYINGVKLAAPTLVVPEIHPNLRIAHGGVEEGNIDPRFSDFSEVWRARRIIKQSVGLESSSPVYALKPQGGTDFVDLDADTDDPRIVKNEAHSETDVIADGVVTSRLNTGLMLGTADCISLALFEPRRKVLALAHVGWKGAVGHLHDKVLDYTKQQHGFEPENAVAYLGPSVHQDNFKTETLHPAQEDEPEWQPYIEEREDGFYVDIAGFVVAALAEHGISRIYQDGIDSAEQNSGLFSYTRHKSDGDRNGRNGFIAAMV